MTRHTKAARMMEAAAGLDRLKHLEDRLASAPVNSRERHALNTAIQAEVDAYRKSLDVEQATATHDANPLADVASGSRSRSSASRRSSSRPPS